MDRDLDFVGVSGERFVNRIVDDFVDQMMKSEVTGRADVHGGTLADGFHATQYFDGIGGVIAVAVDRVGPTGSILGVDNGGGFNLFCCHSAPWKMGRIQSSNRRAFPVP